jgi:hypothetical protein
MTLEEFLEDSREGKPPEGTVGVETDWLPVATLKLTTGRLWIGDPQFAWAEANEGEGCVIDLPRDDYHIEAKGIDFEGVRFASRVRIYRDGSREITASDAFGDAGTDSAQIGIADQMALKASFYAACGDDVDAALDMLEENIDSAVGIFEPDPGGAGCLVYLPSGMGDGGGPVLRLLSDGQCVGIEQEFIDASEPF